MHGDSPGLVHYLPIATTVLALGFALSLLSPLHDDRVQPYRPAGDVLAWTWIRAGTPLINGYAAVFLVGGALYSAWRFWLPPPGVGRDAARAVGTTRIAAGGLLPGIGGALAKGGIVEALYVGEFAGLVLILAGHQRCARAPHAATRNAPVLA